MNTELWSVLLANLQALYVAYQSAHWCSSGQSSYGDHLLYQRLYEDVRDELDRVAERALGVTGDVGLLDPTRFLMTALAAVKLLVIPGDAAASMLVAEKSFLKQVCAIIHALGSVQQLTPGIENLVQGIADKHEEHVYLLTRRVGTEMVRTTVKAIVIGQG